jgi:amino acid adenylation domain-containing protein
MKNKTVQNKLVDVFIKYKDNTAIEYANRFLNYGELDRISNLIALWIIKKGIKKEKFIGVLADDKIYFICAMIGILKAGAAFVPLDPSNPEDRLDLMIDQVNLDLIFIDEKYKKYSDYCSMNNKNTRFIFIENLFEDPDEGERSLDIEYLPEDKTYVYFTSGTTGVPKAIIGKNKGLLHYAEWEIETFITGNYFRVSQFATTSDAFLKEIFVTFLSGSTLCIPRDFRGILETRDLIDWIEKHRINMVHCVPHVFRVFAGEELAENKFPYLKYVVLSGEKIYPRDLKSWYEKLGERIQLVNLYGTTETTILNTYYFINKCDVDRERIPVGKPMKGNRVIILDENMKVCNKGITGEIYIRTPYRTYGYYNDPEQNKKKFIRNPFNNDPDDLLFKTGDLGRLLPDGNIELLGRSDRQVKIRGHRIELEEIEHVLVKHPNVKEVVVIKKEISHDNELLYAYFTRKKEDGMVVETFIDHLTDFAIKEMPEYMVPDFFIKMDTIPKKPNRKIDYDLLPSPFKSNIIEYVSPKNAIERKLSRIWSDILELDKISVKNNFFKIGGHSLNVMSLTYKIHKEFDVKISLAEIFKNPTLEKQAEIIKNKIIDEFAAIAAVEKNEFYPLSSAQKRLYILQQFVAENISYNETQVIMLQGFLEIEKIGRTFRKLLERHEILRTSFVNVNDNPVQRIYKNVKFNIEYSESSEENTGGLIKSFISPFDLSTAPLFRVSLIKVGETKHILVVDIHHIISDRVSLATLIQEFMTLYGGRDLSSLRVQYKDYSGWQNSDERIELLKNQEKFWVKEFAGEIPVLILPIDFPRPEIQDFEGRVIGFEIGSEESQLLKQLALKEESSLFMVLLTMYNILLSKLSGQEDIVVGTPIAGRSHADLEHIIGMFVNTLALRNFPGGKQSFKELLYHIKTRSLQAFENQDFQFEDLVEKVEVTRDAGRNPLFDVMLVLQNVEFKPLEIPGLQLSAFDFEKKQSKFDLTLTGGEFGDKLFFSFEYSTKLFKEETIKRYIKYFRKIISSVLENPGKKIFEIEIILEEEKGKILFEFNNTDTGYPGDKTVHQSFAGQVERTPDHIALIGQIPNSKFQIPNKEAASGGMQLSYRDLNKKSDQLARVLIERSVKPDSIVGIMMEPGLEMIVGIMGILKVGGAFLAIDPDYPEDRIQYMLKDSAAKILLTSDPINRVPTPQCLSFHPSTLPSLSTLTSTCQVSPANLAYIIYTSGSTGKPKGVLVTHGNAAGYVNAFYNEFGISVDDVFMQQTSCTFDVFVEEVFTILLRGGKLAVPKREEVLDISRLNGFICNHCITIISCSPLLLNQLNLPTSLESLGTVRFFISGGDVLRSGYIDNLLKISSVYNAYGPTEATIGATYYPCPKEPGSSIPIGKPIANYKIYILDSYGGLVPLGVSGELCIAGDGIARGYLNNPELTAERFKNYKLKIINEKLKVEVEPFGPILNACGEKNNQKFLRGVPDASRGSFFKKRPPGRRRQKIYKTGDLVRWWCDGNIEFLGRIDHQVKIRGFRIELGEIEKQLLKNKDIIEAVVIAKTFENGDKGLCAYYVSREPLSITGLKEYLSKKIPDYMIPSHFMQIEKIPLTLNGKVDKKGLPDAEIKIEKVYVAPGNEIEEKLVRIWSEVLGIEKKLIGIDSNFFDLGGHSLKATIAISKIQKKLEVKIALAELFKYPTIRSLSRYIEMANPEDFLFIRLAEKKEYHPLSSAQRRLYILNRMEGEGSTFNIIRIYLLEGKLDDERLEISFKTLINRHAALRTSFKMVESEPVQMIQDDVDFFIEHFEDSTGNVEQIVKDFMVPLDLARAPLLKVAIIKIDDLKHILVMNIHHIIADGTSMSIFQEELLSLYMGTELAINKTQYQDFSQWRNQSIISEKIKRQEAYWLKIFENDVPVLNMPTDYPRPDLLRIDSDSVEFVIHRELKSSIQKMMSRTGTTLYIFFLSVFSILLSKYTQQKDIVIGTPIAGRRHADLYRIMGLFANMLPLRNYPQDNKTFISFLDEVKETALNGYENQDSQFEELVWKLGIENLKGHQPLVDIVFVLQNMDFPSLTSVKDMDLHLPKLSFLSYRQEREICRYDLLLEAFEIKDEIHFDLKFRTCLFKKDTIERMASHFKNIVKEVLKNPGITIQNIPMLDPGEKEKLMAELRGSKDHGYLNEKSIHKKDSKKLEALFNF